MPLPFLLLLLLLLLVVVVVAGLVTGLVMVAVDDGGMRMTGVYSSETTVLLAPIDSKGSTTSRSGSSYY